MSRQNGISVEDMLGLEVMEGCKLIAGFKGVRNTISRVNIMADPDILDWVYEGEFLLTTAYFFEKDNIEVQKKLIRVCSDKKLAGIGIKVMPYLDSMPEEVLNLANELNFPLIDIRYSISLSDIMTSTFKEIFNKQASLLERIENVHERFMAVMLEGKGIEEVTQVVHENIKNPVVINLNFSRQVFEQLGDVNEHLVKEILQDVRDFYNPNNGRSELKKLDEDKVLMDGKFIKRMIMPIVLKGNVYGHIFAWSTNTPLGGFDLSIIESASTTIALAVLQELSVKEVEIRYRSEFFEDLISTDVKRKRKALERAHFFNLKPSDYYIIEVMSFKLKFADEKDDEYFFEYLQDHVNTTVTIVEDIMNYLGLDGIVATKLNGIQILLGFDEVNSIDDRLMEFNDRVIKALEEKLKNMNIKIGVGRAYKGLNNVSKSFSDAVKTIRTGRVLMDKKIITFNELGIFKILCQDFLTEELEDFYNTTLKSLVDYDNKKSTELVKTLEAYFKFNGNLTRMSEHLYTHYNTILYRINRINSITGMDLDDSNDRLNLEIALKIRELMIK
ncbi:PucR family transcriptional regulator [Anaerosalibacter massiliensis]|uniref:PucR family transcriptional regulator ligand-binding domain-containing protein n=1 Tax=Anaerosalibacter massiliensis TaxID=1347392 RepID=A0A9X2MKA1_9FIRM|nr:PucR family transcriptional regulator [Anaerosalibacter massiliensis]MCR2045294.1 PucR family transcriptional regulator ligand-binding domain-containing protein [Anaerosalibacter massiliensis]